MKNSYAASPVFIEALENRYLLAAEIAVSYQGSALANNQATAINLGNVALNSVRTVTFVVSNPGDAVLTPGSITLPTGYSVSTPLPATINAAGQANLILSLNTATIGTKAGNIAIASDDLTDPSFTFPITATVVAPEIAVSFNGGNVVDNQATPLSFGDNVQLSLTSTITLQVFNNGGGVLSGISVSAPSGFSVVTNLPSTIAANGGSASLVIGVNTSTPGTKTGTLQISSNDPDENPFEIPLTATVLQPEIAVTLNTVDVPDNGPTIVLADSELGGNGAQLALIVQNLGPGLMSNISVQVPTGFTLLDGLPTSLAALATNGLGIQVLTTTPGLKTGVLRILSNDVNESTFDIPISANVLSGSISVFQVVGTVETQISNGQTTPIDLGVVRKGVPGPQFRFRVKNGGAGVLQVGTETLPAGFTFENGIGNNVQPNDFDDFLLAIDELADVGTFTGNVIIPTNDPSIPNFTFAITGRCAVPDLAVTFNGAPLVDAQLTPVDWGNVQPGSGPQITLIISNPSPVTLAGLSLVVPAGFILDNGVNASGTLVSLDTDSIILRPETETFGVRSGILSIVSDDPTDGSFDIPLQATIVPPKIQVVRGTTILTPSQTTAIDFGTVNQNSIAPRLSFSVQNIGLGLMRSLTATVPAGFTQFDGIPATLGAGSANALVIDADTSTLGFHTGVVSIFSDDPDVGIFSFPIQVTIVNPEIDATLAGVPIISGQPNAVDFGTLQPGQGAQRNFSIKNIGDGVLSITGVNVPAGFTLDNGLPEQLAPGISNGLLIGVDILTFGTKSGILTITTDDPDEPIFSIPLIANILSPKVSVTIRGVPVSHNQSPPVDWGRVFVDPLNVDPPQIRFTVINTGQGLITISGITVPDGFTLVDGLPNNLEPGVSNNMTVAAKRDVLGVHTGAIMISTNDPDIPMFNIPVISRVVVPGLGVFNGNQELFSNQPTPVNIGTVLSSSVGRLNLRIENFGSADLLINKITVPAGFTLVNGLPASVLPDDSDDLIIGVDTTIPGAKIGVLTIETNDVTDPVWSVNLTASVVFAVVLGAGGSGVVQYTDPDGTLVTLTLTGGNKRSGGSVGLGFTGENIVASNNPRGKTVTGTSLALKEIQLIGSNKNTKLNIATKGGDGLVDIGAIDGEGTLDAINAKGVRILDALTLTGLRQADLNALDGAVVTIGTERGPLTLNVPTVIDTAINAAGGIRLLKVLEWTDVGSNDLVTTPVLTALSVNSGFASPLEVTGAGRSTGTITIKGAVNDGDWTMAGNALKASVGSVGPNFDGQFEGTVTQFISLGEFGGTLETGSLRSMVAGSFTNSEVNATGAIGKVSTKGAMNGLRLTAGGNIAAVEAASIDNSSIFAGAPVADGVLVLPDALADFTGNASIGSVKTNAFSNSLIGAKAVVGRLSLGTINTANGGNPFGVVADTILSLTGVIPGGTPLKFGKLQTPEALATILAAQNIDLTDFKIRVL